MVFKTNCTIIWKAKDISHLAKSCFQAFKVTFFVYFPSCIVSSDYFNFAMDTVATIHLAMLMVLNEVITGTIIA